MKFKFLKERWQRVTARIVVILVALILVVGFFINLYWSPILAKAVKNSVNSSSDGLYKINFTSAELHILQGKIVIYNIDLKPDTAVYNQLKAVHLAPNNLYTLHVKKLVLRHIHPFTLYFKKRLNIGNILLSAPQLKISYQLNHTKDTAVKDKRTLYQRISKTFKSVHVDHIDFTDVKLKYEDHSGNKVTASELQELNLSATDLLIDSASMTDKSRFLYCKDVIAEINNFHGELLHGLYRYKMRSLTLSTRTSQVNIQNFNLEPLKPEAFFERSEHTRFTLNIDSIQLNDFDFLSYHRYRILNAANLILSKGHVGVYAHPHFEPPGTRPKKDNSFTFPNAGIYRLKTDLRIDTILLRQIEVTYTELSRRSHKTGYITFNNTNGRALNITTNTEALKKNNNCNIALTTYFMNKGKLDVAFKFDLTGKDLAYSYKGHLGAMDLQSVNPATTTLALVKITSGKLKSFDFNITANKYRAHGPVTLLYNDLKVRLLKADTNKNKLKRMTIETFFANVFILKHNNPDNPGEPPRSFYVNNSRDPNDTFFKGVWKSLLTGIKACVGYGEKKEKEIQVKMAKRATDKEKREQKKTARKQKREKKKREKEKEKQKKALN